MVKAKTLEYEAWRELLPTHLQKQVVSIEQGVRSEIEACFIELWKEGLVFSKDATLDREKKEEHETKAMKVTIE